MSLKSIEPLSALSTYQQKADDPDIWTAHRYTTSPAGDSGKCRIPVLKVNKDGHESTAMTNSEKATMLAKSFFPPRPPTDSPIHFVYLKSACDFNPITKEQIRRQLARLKPYKAPGPDGIPNIVLTKCAVLRYCRNVRPTWVKFDSKDTKESGVVFEVLSTKSKKRT